MNKVPGMTLAPEGSAERTAGPIRSTVVWLRSPWHLELTQEILDPGSLGPRQMLCETIVTAISPGTEIAAFVGLPSLRPQVHYPRLQGYCNVARIIAVGRELADMRAGDRVLTFMSHRSHFIAAREDVLVKLKADSDADQTVCAYLFHLAYNAVLRSGVRAGGKVLVVGLGALGLSSVAMASVAGARVVAVSDQQKPRAIARDFGALDACSRGESESRVRQHLGSGADVVILTTNSWDDLTLALRSAGPFGVIACLGFPGRGQPPSSSNPLDSQYFYAKQLRIEAVGLSPERLDDRGFLRFNERDNLQYIADLIEEQRLRPKAIVSGHYEAVDIERAYRDLIARVDSPVTYLLRWSKP